MSSVLFVGLAVSLSTSGVVDETLIACRSALPKTAIKACSQIVRDHAAGDRKRSMALLYRGMARFRTQSFSHALADLSSVIQLNPRDDVAHVFRGHVHAQMRTFDKAIKDYERAIGLNPESTAALIGLGVLYFRTKQFGKALDAYNLALRLQPYNGRILARRGLTYIELGRRDLGIVDIKDASVLSPDDRGIQRLHHDISHAR